MKEKVMSFCSTLLFLLIAVILPLYIPKMGYSHIGTDKYVLFFYGCIVLFSAMAFILLLFSAMTFIRARVLHRNSTGSTGSTSSTTFPMDCSVTDCFVLAFFLAVTVSYYFSGYGETAFIGNNEWFMGLASQYLFLLIYFFTSRYFRLFQGFIPVMLFTASLISLLGICNRFGYYPIYIWGKTDIFISTIGNINWFCGYLIILVGMEIILFYKETLSSKRFVYGICLFISLLGIITQGSMSGYAALFILLFILLGSALKSRSSLMHYLEILMLLFAGCTCTYISCYFIPDAYVENESVINLVAFSPLPCILLFVIVAIYLTIKFREKEIHLQKIYPFLCFLLFCIFVITGLLIAINTAHPGSIGVLSDIPFFTFDALWGSTRGGTWLVGIEAFRTLSPLQKLIGVGPDCFLAYVYSVLDSSPVLEAFQKPRLANAHCELLTMLVNTGLFGAIAYGGIFISAFVRYIKNKSIVSLAVSFGILAYVINNVFSFQQVISTSLIFLFLGIGEASNRLESFKPSESCEPSETPTTEENNATD